MSFKARQWYWDRDNKCAAMEIFDNIGTSLGNGSGSGSGGILRKTTGGINSNLLAGGGLSSTATNESRQIDLLVFGYACKVFRDDAKALEIDQGKHLIPWMGDANLKIDRYDVRGALYDLTPYEPPAGGYGNRLDYLTAEEQRAELLCEEERYLFLHNNEEDYNTRQEEELKRLQQETKGGDYSQVQFSYDQNESKCNLDKTDNDNANEKSLASVSAALASAVEVEQAFQLPKNLEVPSDMHLPETMKQHTIIEKTARFIAVQGVQMEILLKAKQSNNVQFEFLSQNAALNPYYKHVLAAVKNGTYPPTTDNGSTSSEISKENADQSDMCAMWEERNANAMPIINMPTIKYKPSPDCAYTQLISKIKGVPLPDLQQNHTECDNNPSAGPNSDASNITPILLQCNQTAYLPAKATEANTSKAHPNVPSSVGNCTNDEEPKVQILKNTSALALAQNYSSDSNSDDEDSNFLDQLHRLGIAIPTDNLKNIIDKTAMYVVKNGRKFEETLLSKSEERFTFLLPDNEYYAYYLYRITGDPNAACIEQKQRKAAAVAAAVLSKKGLNGEKNISPVSFLIKSKEDTNSNNLQQQLPVLPQDHSDEEKPDCVNGSSEQKNRHVPEHVQKAIEFVESQLMARNAKLVAANANNLNVPAAGVESFASSTVNTKSLTTHSRVEKQQKSEAERNALYEQQQQNKHKEMKKAEEKVRDKLAQIAREKLGGMVSKEKQLQLERKRKVMAFLNQIKGSSNMSKENNENQGSIPMQTTTSVMEKTDNDSSNDSDVEAVHSIPITSYGPEGNSDEETDALPLTKVIVPPVTPSTYPDNISIATTKANDNCALVIKANHIVVSDDEDVQLVGEIEKTHSRSRSRKPSHLSNAVTSRSESSSSSSSSKSTHDKDYHRYRKTSRKRKSKSKSKSKSTHKRRKSKKSSTKNKKKSKKSCKSRSRSRNRSKSIAIRHKRHRSRSRGRSRSPHKCRSHRRSSSASSSKSYNKTKNHSQGHREPRKRKAYTSSTSPDHLASKSSTSAARHKKSKYEDKNK